MTLEAVFSGSVFVILPSFSVVDRSLVVDGSVLTVAAS